MTRAVIAATLLTVALCGGFLVGAVRTICDTNLDW